MPIHRAPSASIEYAVQHIERDLRERIVQLVAEGDGAYLIVTEKKVGRPAKETRG